MKKILTISILLIGLLSLTAVSAEDNQTDDLIDLNATMSIPDEMLRSMTLHANYYPIEIEAPEDYDENISIYVDESLQGEEPIKTKNYGIYPFEYSEGNHTLRINFPQTSVYKELNLTKKFTISETIIGIGEHQNYASVSAITASDVTGYLTIFINGTQYKKVDLKNVYDRASGYSTQILNLDPGTYNITVIYSGDSKYKRAEKSKIVTIQYCIFLFGTELYYYGDKTLEVSLPSKIKNKKIDISIDGKSYPAEYKSDYGCFFVDLSDLALGEHPISVTYNGDSIYPKQTINDTILIYTHIDVSSLLTYGKNSTVSLKLPRNEKGNLSLYISKEYFETPSADDLYAVSPLINGTATITVSGLDVGQYRFYASYSNQTQVKNTSCDVFVFPQIVRPSSVLYGNEVTLYAVANEDANGSFLVMAEDLDGEYQMVFTIKIINGSGKYTLKHLPVGKIDFSLDYDFNDSMIGCNGFHITVKKWTSVLSQNKNINMYYEDGSTYSVKVRDELGKYRSGNEVKFQIGSKTYYADTDSKGIAKIKISEKAGKYKVTATYRGVSVSNTIVVKKILTLSTVKVKKSAKKLVLTAKLSKKLKGKTITFKFNGKTIKAKTNANGIAKATVTKAMLKKLKVGKKVTYTATYVKESIKKQLKLKNKDFHPYFTHFLKSYMHLKHMLKEEVLK